MWILVNGSNIERIYQCLSDFEALLAEGGQFCLGRGMKGITPGIYYRNRQMLINTARVLLTKSKLYCGNHPGECLIDAPRRNMRYLGWDDHVVFNNLINTFLNTWLAPGETADVWSCPREVPILGTNSGKGMANKFWVRKNNVHRKKYDWQEGYYQGRSIRMWDFGSSSQFNTECG